jgi:hypothetical protein
MTQIQKGQKWEWVGAKYDVEIIGESPNEDDAWEVLDSGNTVFYSSSRILDPESFHLVTPEILYSRAKSLRDQAAELTKRAGEIEAEGVAMEAKAIGFEVGMEVTHIKNGWTGCISKFICSTSGCALAWIQGFPPAPLTALRLPTDPQTTGDEE